MKSKALTLVILIYFLSNFNTFGNFNYTDHIEDVDSDDTEDISHETDDPPNIDPTDSEEVELPEVDFPDINLEPVGRLKCIDCDSRIAGSRCFRLDNDDKIEHCASQFGLCYTSILNGEVLRGCIGDTVFKNITAYEFMIDSIKLCNNNHFCNQDKIEDTCLVCDGYKCKIPMESNLLDMQRACSFGKKSSGCFLSKYDDYRRGCLVNLAEEKRAKCQTSISSKCQSCFTPNCNKKQDLHQQCYFCNGTTDPNCHLITSKHTKITCVGYTSQCLVGIDSNGYTHRKCSTNKKEDDLLFPAPNGYNKCFGDFCNRNAHPTERIKCFKCPIGHACDQMNSANSHEGIYSCRFYPDECYSYRHSEHNITRGCLREAHPDIQTKCLEQMRNDPTSKKLCYLCNTESCNRENNTMQELNSGEKLTNFDNQPRIGSIYENTDEDSRK
ncbi:uncharacterized protein LOC116338237 [Contarinia nasturtii]|uniref:uncharacterized protein LOC116338237 n=1 Tax=Contarinia nasturtii TaxID=265458 RepID=UPI0012D39771|nr:uncharacterized protein LOC116338237 [Contarinia nasturtii]